jgi:hypothetical protein
MTTLQMKEFSSLQEGPKEWYAQRESTISQLTLYFGVQLFMTQNGTIETNDWKLNVNLLLHGTL